MLSTITRILDRAGCAALAAATLALGLQWSGMGHDTSPLFLTLFAAFFRAAIALFLIARLLDLSRFRSWDSRHLQETRPATLRGHGRV
ncbi:MAG: hypothetical protein D6786_00650 [Gammaproteobacteria bacterium]|nr:MAG: hypothetical protein D6786_00650 [Gammaproteobacteria bacterium]